MLFRKASILLSTVILHLLLLTFPSYGFQGVQPKSVTSVSTNSVPKKTGFIRFNIKVDTLFLYLNGRYHQLYRLQPPHLLELPAKTHSFLIFGKKFPEKTLRLQIPENDTLTFTHEIPQAFTERNVTTYGVYARIHWNANLMILTSEESSITVNGKKVGKNGLARINLPQGNHLLRIVHPTGASHQQFVTIESHRLKTVEHYFLPSQTISKAYALFPGASQFHKRQYLKGTLLLASTATTLGFALVHNNRLRSVRQEFHTLYQRYQDANNENSALELGNRLVRQKQVVVNHQRTRNGYFLAACLLYAFNLYDAFQKPKSGYRKPRLFNPYRNLSVNLKTQSIQIGLKLEF